MEKNIGHFDNEIDRTGLENLEDIEVGDIKLQVRRFVFPDVAGVIVLAAYRFVTVSFSLDHMSVHFPTFLGMTGKSQWQAQFKPKRRKTKTQTIVAHQPGSDEFQE